MEKFLIQDWRIDMKTLGFEVWVPSTYYDNSTLCCVAQFQFWQECLDYKDYCHGKGLSVWLRTLNPDGKTFRTERRDP